MPNVAPVGNRAGMISSSRICATDDTGRATIGSAAAADMNAEIALRLRVPMITSCSRNRHHR